MKKFLPVVALSLLAAACSSSTPGGMSRWMEAYGNNFPVPQPGQAAVYLAQSAWYLQRMEKDWPKIQFFATKERS